MRKIVLIFVFVLFFYILEFLIFNVIGRWAVPNFLILAVIFFNLAFGVRYGLLTAVAAGIVKDSFSTGFFGINVFSFIVCAYMTTVLKRYFYDRSSRSSRLLIVFFVVLINVTVHFFLYMMFGVSDVIATFKYILIPELLLTLFVTIHTFRFLKKCVLKLFV